MTTPVLKSAWQLAKEIADERKMDVNSIKVDIIRAGKRGIIQEYTYQKDGKTVNVYDEKEVQDSYDLSQRLGGFKIEATSKQIQGGGWIPELEVVEPKGDRVELMIWRWSQKEFPTKEAADKYAEFCGSQKLRRIVEGEVDK